MVTQTMVTQPMTAPNPLEENETTTEKVPGGLTPDEIGMEFVRQYYTLMNEAPHYLYRLYSAQSKFVHGSIVGKHQTPIIGQEKIRMEIERLNFQQVYTKIRQVDCYSTLHELLIVLICGEISILKNPARRFAQQIVLAPQGPLKYYVVNDVFRYIDEDCIEVCEPGGMESESSEGCQEEEVMRHPDPSSDQLMPNDISVPSTASVPVVAPNEIMAAAQQHLATMALNDHLVDGVTASATSVELKCGPQGAPSGNQVEPDYLLMNSRGARTNGSVDMMAPSTDINASEEHQTSFGVFQQESQVSGLSSSSHDQQGAHESTGEAEMQTTLQEPQLNDIKPQQEECPDDASTTVQLSTSLVESAQSEEAAPVAESANGGIKTWASITHGMGSSPAKKAPTPMVAADPRPMPASTAGPPASTGGQFQATGSQDGPGAKPQRGSGNRNSGNRQQPFSDNATNMNSNGDNRSYERKQMGNRGGPQSNVQFNGPAQNGYQAAPNNSNIASGTSTPASESLNPNQIEQRGGPQHYGDRRGGNYGPGGGPQSGGFQSAPDDFQIFVGNLPQDVTQEELKRRFSEFGTVVDVRINRGSGGIPFGFVVFDNRDSVQKILEMTQGEQQTRIFVRNNSHRINIEEKKPRTGPVNRNGGGRFPPGGMKEGRGGPGGNWNGGNQGPPRGPGGDGGAGGGPGRSMKGGPGGGGQMGGNKPRGGGGRANESQQPHAGGSMNGGHQQQQNQSGQNFNNQQSFQNSYGPRR